MILQYLASKYLNANVADEDEALQGARDIIAEWLNENIFTSVKIYVDSSNEKVKLQRKS